MAATVVRLSRRDPPVAAIVRSWRRLTGKPGTRAGKGEPTLVACSGGADSCALVAALATATDRMVVAHVVHDLRPREEAMAGRDAAWELAERLGLSFVEAEVSVRGVKQAGAIGNREAAARAARYAALRRMAIERGIRFVATAHHDDDQLETVLMSLLRGAGAAGIRGMRLRRPLMGGKGGSGPVWLIRPMIGCGADRPDAAVTREVCRRLCDDAGVVWSEDATNADTRRVRAAVRHRVLPVLKEIRPDAAARGAAAAVQSARVGGLLRREAARIIAKGQESKDGLAWERARLRAEPSVVLGEFVLRMRTRVCGRKGGAGVSRRAIEGVVQAIRDRSTEPRRFGIAGMVVLVTARRVTVGAANAGFSERAD